MANLGGGGAEEQARLKQYGYKANSSLVLNSDERRRDTHDEPSGEPESLRGKIDPKSFGDRVVRGRPHELDERLNKSKKKKERDDDRLSARESKRPRLREVSVLTDTDDGVYQPQTRETRAAYETMLNIIQQQLGGQPLSIICGAADEILAVLKNESVKNHEKKMEIEKLLSTISNQFFNQLVVIGKRITEYQEGGESVTEKASEDDGLDYDVGVALEFEEDDDDE
ncbi:DExH-box ATP-dependent RNA helicase DExH13 [Cardamine amara subsp. amara]|uniref:DExH-box ATP-dependent RNA helicase DExH13 n=1 Tax=Cardamine amara subsp. amara TaxID=228776 RepID=A0ABD1ALC6_CARAN